MFAKFLCSLLLGLLFASAHAVAADQCSVDCVKTYDACTSSGYRKAQRVRQLEEGYERSCSMNRMMCKAACAEKQGECSSQPELLHETAASIYGYQRLLQGKPANEETVRSILVEASGGNGGLNEFDFERYMQGLLPGATGWLDNVKRCLGTKSRIGGFGTARMPSYNFKEGFFDFGFLRKSAMKQWNNCYSGTIYKLSITGSDEALRLRLPPREAELLSRSNQPDYDFDHPGFSVPLAVPEDGYVVVGVFGTLAPKVAVRQVPASDPDALRCGVPVSPLIPDNAFQKSMATTIVTLTLDVDELRVESRSLGSKHTFVEGVASK